MQVILLQRPSRTYCYSWEDGEEECHWITFFLMRRVEILEFFALITPSNKTPNFNPEGIQRQLLEPKGCLHLSHRHGIIWSNIIWHDERTGLGQGTRCGYPRSTNELIDGGSFKCSCTTVYQENLYNETSDVVQS